MPRILRIVFLGAAIICVVHPLLPAAGTPEKFPEAVTRNRDVEYISPRSSPGIQDTVEIHLQAEADSGGGFVVTEYRLTLSDGYGRVVREWSDGTGTHPGPFRRLLEKIGLRNRRPVKMPLNVTWDGTSTAGTPLGDGSYTYVLEVRDSGGGFSRSSPKRIVIDNTPPSAVLLPDYRVFSPDGDGRRDVLPVSLQVTEAAAWKAVVTDAAGGKVASADFGDFPPSVILWDGRDNDGRILPDGEYILALHGADPAGNSFSTPGKQIIVDARPRDFKLAADFAAFSPNANGVQDRLRIFPVGLVPDRLLDLKVEILDGQGAVRATLPVSLPFDAGIYFDGRSDGGEPLPDGAYRARATAKYENGAVAVAVTPSVTLDTTAPRVRLGSSSPAFSPGVSGGRGQVDVYLDVSEEGEWKGTVYDGREAVVAEYLFPGIPPREIRFDKVLPDDTYTLVVEGRDRAGNHAVSNRLRIVVDTGEAALRASADLTAFSPNGDGVKDIVTIFPETEAGKKTEAFTMTIRNEEGRAVRTIQGKGQIPSGLPWDGREDTGKIAPDGEYRADLQVVYVNGKKAEAATGSFALDTVFPEALVKSAGLALESYPDGSVNGIHFVQSTSEDAVWTGEMFSAETETVLARAVWENAASDFRWDGRGPDGRIVPDGRYFYRLTGEDPAGNRRVFRVSGITMKTRKPDLGVVPSLAAFSPDGNGILDTISFDLASSFTQGIGSWKLDIEQKSGGVVASLGAGGDPGLPRTVVWAGRDETGLQVPDGTYSAILTVDYGGGKTFTRSSASFRIDTEPPVADFRLKPALFSPDEDGKDDVLEMMLTVKGRTPVDSWSIRVLDAEGEDFALLSGSGRIPPKISWNGRGGDGELVKQAADYTLAYTVRNVLGNEARGEAQIVVDVLVYPGRRGKIRISPIQFSAWEADLTEWSAWHRRANTAVLDEVAAMLKKFPSYGVRLEGHAVAMMPGDSIEAEHEHRLILLPLSLSRSEAVLQELVRRGIDDSRIEAAGIGGDDPLVPFSDERMRWVNRRVEFFLVR